MARYISRNNTVSARTLKRRPIGAVIRHHCGGEDVKFTRVVGGWVREREDVSLCAKVVSSAAVAAECNRAIGCRESWARVY